MTPYDDQRAALEKLQGLMGRAAARAHGLKIFGGPQCPVRSHGRARRISDGRCICCLEEVLTMKQVAKEAGKAAALKTARAEVARELKREEQAKLKAAALALKAQQLEERRKAARVTKREASRAAKSNPPSPAVVAAGALRGHDDGPEHDSPPWE